MFLHYQSGRQDEIDSNRVGWKKFRFAGEASVTLELLKNPEDPRFVRFLESHEPYGFRIRGVIAETKDKVSVWVDDPADLHLAVHRARGWLAPVGAPDDVVSRLDELEEMAEKMELEGDSPNRPGDQDEKGVLRISALPASIRDAIAEKCEIIRQTGCGLYTLKKEDFAPYSDGPPIDRIREDEYEYVANMAQHGERMSYLSERLAEAPHTAIHIGGKLAAYMIVHSNGSIGMLHTVEKFRNRGFGRHVASALAEKQFARGVPVYCYIVDGNEPSQRVFTSLGFRRVADVFWCVFKRREQ